MRVDECLDVGGRRLGHGQPGSLRNRGIEGAGAECGSSRVLALGIEEMERLRVERKRHDVAGGCHHGPVHAHGDERLPEPGVKQRFAAQMLDELDLELHERGRTVDEEVLGPDAEKDAAPVLAREPAAGEGQDDVVADPRRLALALDDAGKDIHGTASR